MNTDDATRKAEDWNAAGGVLRDSNGSWIVGFQKFVGHGTVLNSELWAILLGFDGSPSTTIVRRIKKATRSFEQVKFQFISKEGNRLADWLAKTCVADATNIQIMDVPSLYIQSLLIRDISGTHRA